MIADAVGTERFITVVGDTSPFDGDNSFSEAATVVVSYVDAFDCFAVYFGELLKELTRVFREHHVSVLRRRQNGFKLMDKQLVQTDLCVDEIRRKHGFVLER